MDSQEYLRELERKLAALRAELRQLDLAMGAARAELAELAVQARLHRTAVTAPLRLEVYRLRLARQQLLARIGDCAKKIDTNLHTRIDTLSTVSKVGDRQSLEIKQGLYAQLRELRAAARLDAVAR
ncbi:MAG: hypothetical protein DWI68_04830 [Chloroflexi bacterium]|nr:MAG: hypothetical protein DWI68_04830 [Chloroflexota bacterium]